MTPQIGDTIRHHDRDFTVLDLTFAAGRLVEAVDRSEAMARLRAAAGDGSLLSLFKPLEPKP